MRLPARVRGLVIIAPLAFYAAVMMLPLASERAFDAVTREDGLIEYAQFFALVACGLLSGTQARRLWCRARGWALVYGAFALVCLAAAGEEISWGQRIFGIETPQWYAANNHQAETTIHNLQGVQELQAPVVVGVLAILSGLSIWGWTRGRSYSTIGRGLYLLIPHPMLLPAWICMIGYVGVLTLTHDVAGTSSSFYIGRLQEPAELILIVGVAVFLAHVGWLERGRRSLRSAST